MTVSQTQFDRRKFDGVLVVGTLGFFAIAAIGLYIVKWYPYWNKAHVAAAKHSIGNSIVSGAGVVPPPVGWDAALQYAGSYFTAVWTAVVLGLVLGAAVQVLVPRQWLLRAIGGSKPQSAAIAGALSLGGMMCTCCVGPVVVGLRRARAGIGSALAFFLGNPVLNPATLIFMGFVLGWGYSAVRLIAGVVLIAVAVLVAERIAGGAAASVAAPEIPPAAIEAPNRSWWTLCVAFVRELGYEMVAILPGYIIIVFVLGALRAWFFPADFTIHAASVPAIALVSLIGTMFVIPTAGEVPIVQTLMAHGMSQGAALALIITLPAISLPSIFIVRGAFPRKVLAATFGIVFAVGLVVGTVAQLLHV